MTAEGGRQKFRTGVFNNGAFGQAIARERIGHTQAKGKRIDRAGGFVIPQKKRKIIRKLKQYLILLYMCL